MVKQCNIISAVFVKNDFKPLQNAWMILFHIDIKSIMKEQVEHEQHRDFYNDRHLSVTGGPSNENTMHG